jgi:hypothetical protein
MVNQTIHSQKSDLLLPFVQIPAKVQSYGINPGRERVIEIVAFFLSVDSQESLLQDILSLLPVSYQTVKQGK